MKKQVYAKKSFGQNFLVDENYVRMIIAALDPQKNETIIEIGAGRGALTEKLLQSGANIVAIELEHAMIAVLKTQFSTAQNLQIIERDALKVDFEELLEPRGKSQESGKAKLVANLPYYISTAILQKLIEQRECFSEMILMFQREVVERITAKAGEKERGFLTVLVEAYLETEKLFDVPPNAFRPAPKVWSAIVRLKPKQTNFSANSKIFRQIISAAFAQKRKTILNNLKNAPISLKEKLGDAEVLLKTTGIEPNRRAETLTIEEWQRFAEALV